MIGARRGRLPDWWDQVALLISEEVFEGQVTGKQIEHMARLLRELVKKEQDILGKSD